MNYILKLIFFIAVIAKLVAASNVQYLEVAVLLLAAAVSIYREKFGSSIPLLIAEGAAIYYGIGLNTAFALLYGLMIYDLITCRYPIGVLPVVLLGLYHLKPSAWMDFLLILCLCGVFAYMKNVLQAKEEIYRNSFDKQREYSYELEQVKVRLLSAAEEAAHMAEIKERNRIARQIHDSAGHSIAGILMQLQAVRKLYDRDTEKSALLLANSIAALSDTLTMIRDTVHNIKPTEKLGIEYLRGIVDNFNFCPVDFSVSGDIGELPANIMQILHYNIKEALTNVSKYSKATRVELRLEVNESYARLFIKDNGVGSVTIKEGLGISGMKERIYNLGGTISVSTENGFLIVCVIPLKKAEVAKG